MNGWERLCAAMDADPTVRKPDTIRPAPEVTPRRGLEARRDAQSVEGFARFRHALANATSIRWTP